MSKRGCDCWRRCFSLQGHSDGVIWVLVSHPLLGSTSTRGAQIKFLRLLNGPICMFRVSCTRTQIRLTFVFGVGDMQWCKRSHRFSYQEGRHPILAHAQYYVLSSRMRGRGARAEAKTWELPLFDKNRKTVILAHCRIATQLSDNDIKQDQMTQVLGNDRWTGRPPRRSLTCL
jgi:hypothetical protein